MLHAQPIVDLDTGGSSNSELLVRTIDDRGDLVPPDSFLYVAERYGLSNRLDAWVLAQAFDLLEATGEDPAPVTLAVNLSGTSVGDNHLLAVLEQRRSVRAASPPQRLVLQVAEPAATQQLAAARAFAERFRDLGCRLTFGTVAAISGRLTTSSIFRST